MYQLYGCVALVSAVTAGLEITALHSTATSCRLSHRGWGTCFDGLSVVDGNWQPPYGIYKSVTSIVFWSDVEASSFSCYQEHQLFAQHRNCGIGNYTRSTG